MHYAEMIHAMPPKRQTAILTVLTAVAVMWGCGAGQERNDAHPAAGSALPSDVTLAKQDIDRVGEALRELRDARSDTQIQERLPQVRVTANALAVSLSAVQSHYEATVAAGQNALSTWDRQSQGRPLDPQSQRSPLASDLAMAMDSLLMCRTAYAQVSGSYRSQLLLLLQSLDRDLTLGGMQTMSPTIVGLLEDRTELRSILVDVSAKSEAVMTEIAMLPIQR